MSFTYNNAIPASGNNPSNDQPQMLANFASIQSLVDIDHIDFASANAGRHKQVQMPISNGGSGTIPAPLIAGEGTLYTKTSGESQLFYTPDTTANEYQLTRTITASFPLFGTNTNYQVGPPSLTGGWTFLPGGLILQYGSALLQPTGTTITFPIAFTSACFSLTITINQNINTSQVCFARTSSTTNFTITCLNGTNGPASLSFNWIAIGK